jgi:NADH dehydrogenase/NADH:ubiquinone oxidoreductase subunit G
VNLTIDQQPVEAKPGETVMQVALRHGISIPRLCAHPHLPPFGACRMCLVEIEGVRGYPASCSTPAAEGMVVRTDTEKLHDLRRGILELILLEHPSACLLCDLAELCERYRPSAEKAGSTTGCHTCNNKETCEVKELAHALNVESLPVPPRYRGIPIERSDPFIDRDLNLCILCGRCVRICKAHQGETTIDFVGRGSDTRIGEAFGRSLTEAGCKFCGSCVDVCPTGSLADRYAKWHGKPDAAVESTCILCEAACALKFETRREKLIAARAVQGDVPVCVLGRFAIPEFVNDGGRLISAAARVGGRLREMPWNEALAIAAERLKPHGGNAFALVCDTSLTVEARHVLRRFTREAMRSPHYIELQPDLHGVARTQLPAGVRAALLTGGFIPDDQLAQLEVLIVQDTHASATSERASAVLPAAAFTEIDGTWIDGAGRRRPLRRAARPPGMALPDWRIAADLATALGAEGYGYESVAAIAAELEMEPSRLILDRVAAPAPARDARQRVTHFRGHALHEKVAGLRSIPVADEVAATPVCGG